jgi:hypothetical protein
MEQNAKDENINDGFTENEHAKRNWVNISNSNSALVMSITCHFLIKL